MEILHVSDSDFSDEELEDVPVPSSQGSSHASTAQTLLWYPESLLAGFWGPIRLFREAKLDDPFGCFQWLKDVGLVHGSSHCHHHRLDRTLKFRPTRDTFYWQCSRSSCPHRVISGFKDSIFEDSRLSMGKVLMALHCFAYNHTYENTQRNCFFGLEDEVPLAHSTISRKFHYFREKLVETINTNELNGWGPIGGPGVVVQVDEAQIGRRKYHVGRLVTGTWVCGMIDSNGRVRMEICERRDRQTLTDIIQRNVMPGSIIHSDSWRGYGGLEELGYQHGTVNHSLEFVSAEGVHTQAIESQWRSLRRMFTPGGRPHEEIADYLIEFIWRQRCRNNSLDPFVELIKLFSIY